MLQVEVKCCIANMFLPLFLPCSLIVCSEVRCLHRSWRKGESGLGKHTGVLDHGLDENLPSVKMSSSNRELVIDFISYKLSQRGHSWSQLEGQDETRTEFAGEEDMASVPNGSPSWHPAASHVVNGAAGHRNNLEAQESVPAAEVRQALREAGDEFELRYRRAFSDLTSQLHITPGTAYQSFEQVVNELFRDGVNWGRIVAFFSFGGALCVESVDKEMQVLVGRIVSWMTTYLTDHLDPWIQENGGWVRSSFSKGELPILLCLANSIAHPSPCPWCPGWNNWCRAFPIVFFAMKGHSIVVEQGDATQACPLVGPFHPAVLPISLAILYKGLFPRALCTYNPGFV